MNELTTVGLARQAMRDLQAQMQVLDERIRDYDRELKGLAAADEQASRVQTIPGVGPIMASATADQDLGLMQRVTFSVRAA